MFLLCYLVTVKVSWSSFVYAYSVWLYCSMDTEVQRLTCRFLAIIAVIGCRCPKTVENFCVHSRNGYYNSHIFHRVIKGFMIQTGDPLGLILVTFPFYD